MKRFTRIFSKVILVAAGAYLTWETGRAAINHHELYPVALLFAALTVVAMFANEKE